MATNDTPATEVEKTTEVVSIDRPSIQELVNAGIAQVIEATGIDVQKNRYKAMRAIAWQAFSEAVEAGTFEEVVDRAIANVDKLPSGWEIKKPAHTKEAPAKATETKTAPAAKTAPARRLHEAVAA